MKIFQHKRIYLILLGLIFVLALVLRLYSLNNHPSGFHVDEASLGYNGYSFLHTGKDDSGHAFPLYIDMFGDNRPTGYHYLTILPIAVFGLSEFSTRLPGALFGAFSVFAVYFLAIVLFSEKKDDKWVVGTLAKKIGLVASLFLAITPWHVVLSRASAETIVALFFILFGFGFVIRSLKMHSSRDVVVGTVLLSVSFFFYHTPRVFVPLLYFIILLFFAKDIHFIKKVNFKKALILVFCLLSLVSFLLVFVINGGTGRFSQVNIFGHPETKLVLEEELREDGIMHNNIFAARAFHNKAVNYSLTFAQNYLDYFSGQFLFISGGLPKWYVVDKMGLVYIVLLPLLLYGLFLILKSDNKFLKVILIWLLVAPIVAAITMDDVPNINRAIVMFPMVELAAAYGTVVFFSKKRKYSGLLVGAFSLLLLANFLYFQNQYYIQTTVHRPWYRNSGFDTMIKYVKANYNNYDKIVVTKANGGIYPLILFYMQYDPAAYQREGSTKDTEYTGFGKFFFVPQGCPSTNGDSRFPQGGKILYVNQGQCPDKKNVHFVDFFHEDNTRVFRLEERTL